MIFDTTIGISSYGVAIPRLCIETSEIELAQGKVGEHIPEALGVRRKTVPSVDEDTAILAVSAGYSALQKWKGKPDEIHALFIGSESHPYAVKPTGTIVQEALSLSPLLATADLQFACKAGTQALQIASLYVKSGFTQTAMAIGADTAQSRPGDILEFTAGAGAGAYIVGKTNLIATLLATVSVASDTPDFWRRQGEDYPQHAGRFSGGPGYFSHVQHATQLLLKETNLKPSDIEWCVFHTPNAKFPTNVAKLLGFTPKQMKHSLPVQTLGNTYAGASMIALAQVLDNATPHQKILVTSYGSGAGSDSFLFETTPALSTFQKRQSETVVQQLASCQSISYQEYRRNTEGRK